MVDDDPAITGLLEAYCEDMDCEVRTLNDSREAMSLAQTWQPDLITLDLDMPHKSGVEILTELRADAATRTTPVLIVSAYAREFNFEKDGPMDQLQKPVSGKCFRDRASGLLGSCDRSMGEMKG